MKIKLLFIFLILFYIKSYSQNLIPNSSFETDNILYQKGAVDRALHWTNFESSDWYDGTDAYSGLVFYNSAPQNNTRLHAHSGDKYIGFGSCEGAQVKLTKKTERMKWITISFWFSPRDYCDTKINVYLLKDKASGDALKKNCNSPDISYEVHFEVPVKAMQGLDQKYTPGNWYFYQSEPILAADDEYEWFAIKGNNIPGVFDDINYVFVDDFSLTEMDFCKHICVSSGGDVENTRIIPTGMIGNSSQTFYTSFKNANKIEFRVFNKWGEMMYESIEYDPNGLIDDGWDDFSIVWNGHHNLSGGGDVIIDQTYVVQIDAESCRGADFHYTGHVTVLGINNPPALTYPLTKNRNPPDCCPEYKIYQNVDFYSYSRTDVDNYIKAGYDVTSPPYGNVVVRNGADVRFFAGNSIELLPGFMVEQGGSFLAAIEACAVTPRPKKSNSKRDYYEDLINNSNEDNTPINTGIHVSPNPNNGIFTLQTGTLEQSEIIVYDLLGNVVYQTTATAVINIDISRHSKGVYFVKVITNSGTIANEKIVYQ